MIVGSNCSYSRIKAIRAHISPLNRYSRCKLSNSPYCYATVKSPGPKKSQLSSNGTHKDRSRLRNIGIVAHINAGKTTTTERILYHAGSTNTVGDVDTGNTVTDYLIQERNRGITITSAAVTFNWKRHRINLIDTPGHVDFTMEVERSLAVLDGAVTILDASAGVEAQTVTVWNQAMNYNLPNIIFLNKTDKPQADCKMCLKDLKSQLDIRAGLIYIPVKMKTNEFKSVIDVIDRNLLLWTNPEEDKGASFVKESLNMNRESPNEVKLDKRYIEQLEEERERLINHLSDCDESFASHVIECDKISDVSGEEIKQALRRSCLDCKFSPVLVGSSFKYLGVQQLMDAILNYLPSPIEREASVLARFRRRTSAEDSIPSVAQSTDEACAFIFKIMHDKRMGALNYIRVCSGEIKRSQRLKNLQNSNQLETIKKVYRAFADELREIEAPVEKDDIVVVTGLTESRTGDILVEPNFKDSKRDEIVERATKKQDQDECLQEMADEYEPSRAIVEAKKKQPFRMLSRGIIVPNISKMEPVYYCTIESPTSALQMKLEAALGCLSREDPSFTYEIDSLGVGTIRGMGKLHLEVTRDRIQSEYGVDSILGPMQISYRETIEDSAVQELEVNRLINSVSNRLSIKLYVRAKPKSGVWTARKLRLDTSPESDLARLRQDHRKAIDSGLAAAMAHGPSLGYPMIDCDVLLLAFKANYKCALAVISSAAAQCLGQALARCRPVLLEPMMLLEVVAPRECNGAIVSDLTSSRRGLLLSAQARSSQDSIVLRAHTPLATLADYSEHLRILTSGRASFSMELHNYVAMSDAEKRNIVRI